VVDVDLGDVVTGGALEFVREIVFAGFGLGVEVAVVDKAEAVALGIPERTENIASPRLRYQPPARSPAPDSRRLL